MVTNPRTQKGLGTIRLLNVPVSVQVQVDGQSYPVKVLLAGHWFKVAEVVDRWRIDDEWWRDRPISRMYYGCILEDGRRVTMVQDLVIGQWYRQYEE